MRGTTRCPRGASKWATGDSPVHGFPSFQSVRCRVLSAILSHPALPTPNTPHDNEAAEVSRSLQCACPGLSLRPGGNTRFPFISCAHAAIPFPVFWIAGIQVGGSCAHALDMHARQQPGAKLVTRAEPSGDAKGAVVSSCCVLGSALELPWPPHSPSGFLVLFPAID